MIFGSRQALIGMANILQAVSKLKQTKSPVVIDCKYCFHRRRFRLSVLHHVLLNLSQCQHRAYHKDGHLRLVIWQSYRTDLLHITYQAEIALLRITHGLCHTRTRLNSMRQVITPEVAFSRRFEQRFELHHLCMDRVGFVHGRYVIHKYSAFQSHYYSLSQDSRAPLPRCHSRHPLWFQTPLPTFL